MKGNISRQSQRPGDRYSGVFQVQGGMVTDADLGEQAQIARRRADALGHDTAGCGVPEEGGAVVLDAGGPRLAEGVVYAEGVRGETRAMGALPDPLSLLSQQVDLPLAPPMPTTGDLVVYADLWERVVVNLEDPDLSDPGLHGAETAFRQRTMAQIKVAPAGQEGLLGQPDGPVPRIGGGVLSVTPVDPETIADECDPCADTVTAEQTVANALFRIEVLHVFGGAQAPDRITLAWSAENGAAVASATVNAEDFGRAGAVYEFFSTVTECHFGVHDDNGAVARSSFATSLAGGAADPAAPGGGNWPYVRRWDGAMEVDFGAGTVDRVGAGSGVAVAGRVVTLTVDAFTAEIDFEGRPVVAGDYWLVELRRFADTPVRAVQETPVGILHSYCALFRVTDGAVVEPTDAERRRLAFPTLADLPATHVGFVNNCPKLYDDAENVQEALDNLCAIEAADIAFDPTGCPRLFDRTDNVQDALINLCKVDFGNERLLRLLHDWGVICGVIPVRLGTQPARMRWSAGAILNRAGEIGEVSETELELDKLIGTDQFHFDSVGQFASALRRNEVCIALSIAEGGEILAHLAPRSRAFGPDDATFMSVFAACRAQKPAFNIKDDLTALPQASRNALDKVFYGAAYSKIAASQRLNAAEQRIARSYNDDLISRYKLYLDDPDQAARIDAKIAAIDARVRPGDATGPVRETRLLEREAQVYRLVRETEEERVRRCLCDALMPRCPAPGERPHLVPIACIEGRFDGGILLDRVCPWCCRKQAMSWRMVQYYFSEMRERFASPIEEFCCPPPDGGGGTVVGPGGFSVLELDENLKPEVVFTEAQRILRIVQGRHPPSDYKVQPRVANLGIDQAREALAGNGVDIAETIDVTDSAAISKLRNATVGFEPRDLIGDTGTVKPGDKVALIVQDGLVVDYVKVETGGGKFIFDRPATKDLKLAEDTRREIAVATKALDGRIAAAKSADRDLEASLTVRRDEISRETDEAQQALDRLRTERDDTVAQIDALRGTIAEVTTERETVMKEVETTRGELTKLADEQRTILAGILKERDAVVTTIRRETPVTAVVGGEERFATVLARRGVTNVAGLAEMPEDELRTVAGEAGLNLNTARRLKREATEWLNTPIR